MKIALVWTFAAALAAIASEATAVRTFGTPVVWADLDVDALKGRPTQLAWSDDDRALYLQVVEGTRADALRYRHYLITKSEKPALLDRQPAWAQAYWKWKSARSFFGDPLMKIDVDRTQQMLDDPRDRNTPYLESGRKAPETLQAKAASGKRVTNRLLLRGHVIGEFVDEQIFPGYTFSWSPEPLQLIAFRSPAGRLTIMNGDAETETVGDSKDVWLPAWSESGDWIAYLQRTGRKKFVVKVVSYS
jgi:hypothetical protein